jgi:hypothetical protein
MPDPLDQAGVSALDEELANIFVRNGEKLPSKVKTNKINLLQVLTAHYAKDADLAARIRTVSDDMLLSDADVHKEEKPCEKPKEEASMPSMAPSASGPSAVASGPTTSRKVHCKYMMSGTACDKDICTLAESDHPVICRVKSHRYRATYAALEGCSLWHLRWFGKFSAGYTPPLRPKRSETKSSREGQQGRGEKREGRVGPPLHNQTDQQLQEGQQSPTGAAQEFQFLDGEGGSTAQPPLIRVNGTPAEEPVAGTRGCLSEAAHVQGHCKQRPRDCGSSRNSGNDGDIHAQQPTQDTVGGDCKYQVLSP